MQPRNSSSSARNGDGFTSEELATVLHPPNPASSRSWTPTLTYEEVNLGNLQPGPRNLKLTGRVVNFHDVPKPSKKHKSVQGFIKVMLADDTGTISVRLWYSDAEYTLRLGNLVTIWTVHISKNPDHMSLAPNTARLFASIFPETERNCHFIVSDTDDGTQLKMPFNYEHTQLLPGLMSLRNFIDGGFDVQYCKLLLCVKSIGARKRFINKNGITSELLSIKIFDSTAEARFTVYGPCCDSASSWEPSKTILLLSRPGWKSDRIVKLSLTADSRVDINPEIDDAKRLRNFAQQMSIQEHVNPPFPDVDIEAFETGSVRALYTLADIDDVVREDPQETIMGYLSVIMMELHIVTNFKRNMLLCNECCGVPIFANSITVNCQQCEKSVHLRMNPSILGGIIDETGQIESGKLILSDKAWQDLLGRSTESLVNSSIEEMQYLEQRLLLLRVTMGFAVKWNCDIGRVAIWSVQS